MQRPVCHKCSDIITWIYSYDNELCPECSMEELGTTSEDVLAERYPLEKCSYCDHSARYVLGDVYACAEHKDSTAPPPPAAAAKPPVAKQPRKQRCKYGEKCHCKTPAHRAEFTH